jgi:hypothetical protein
MKNRLKILGEKLKRPKNGLYKVKNSANFHKPLQNVKNMLEYLDYQNG